MANPLQQLKDWLLDKRNFRVAWFAKDPKLKAAPQEALSQLPEETAQRLVSAANDLPVHPRDEEAVVCELSEAITQWRDHPHTADNSIVILSDPVSSISRILIECLDKVRQKEEREPLPITLLDWIERPLQVESIKQRIKDKLDLADDSSTDPSCNEEDAEGKPTLMVIPNLSWCFLRSADGLDGLDYLQDLIPRDHSRFWVIGSGRVGWDYLKSTIKLNAYCGKVKVLPFLSGEDLQDWIEPIIQQFNISFSNPALYKRLEKGNNPVSLEAALDRPVEALTDVKQEISATIQSSVRAAKEELLSDETEEKERSAKQEYFDRLADISDGVSTTALQIFIKSLRCKEQDSDSSSSEDSNASTSQSAEREHSPKRIVASIPKLPPLPDLSQNDLYLLYSLILHGDLNIKALSESLGDAPNVVNNQVQILRGLGVLEQKGNVLKANPAYYPRIRRELDRNNFIIEVP